MSKIHIKMSHLFRFQFVVPFYWPDHCQQQMYKDNFIVHCCLFFCPYRRLFFNLKLIERMSTFKLEKIYIELAIYNDNVANKRTLGYTNQVFAILEGQCSNFFSLAWKIGYCLTTVWNQCCCLVVCLLHITFHAAITKNHFHIINWKHKDSGEANQDPNKMQSNKPLTLDCIIRMQDMHASLSNFKHSHG